MGVVLKYGGSSVETIQKIDQIAHYISERKKDEDNIVVVVSAMGKSTDDLINLAKGLSSDLPKREIDTLLATGEQQTIALLAIALRKYQISGISLTGFQAGFVTTNTHTKGIIKDINIERVLKHLKEDKVVVVAGFQGMTSEGDITTLGRGGSDTSAVALAAKLGYACEIYTDVDGIYTVDPRVYQDAKKIDQISYEELMEMAALGAGVIETRSVELAKKYNVPLYIARSLSKKGQGTYIMNDHYLFEEKPITGISITDNVAVVTFEGLHNNINQISKIFNVVSAENINLDMISQNFLNNDDVLLSFSIDGEDMEAFNEAINKHHSVFNGLSVEIRRGIIKLSLVGVGMASNFGVAAKVFHTLSEGGIPYYHISTSEISISCTINESDKARAVEHLALAFNL